MSDKEKTVVRREDDAEETSPLDLDLDKAIEKLVEEFKGLEDHFDIKEDELGVVMVTNLRETITCVLASFNAKRILIRKLTEV